LISHGPNEPVSAEFYDGLAPYYHLLYGDWNAAIAMQGDALARLLTEHGLAPGSRVLDAACGIGTQTLGLLQQGYAVQASDLSAGAIQRLQVELAHRGLDAPTGVDDLRTLSSASDASQDAVIACDNSVPYLLNNDALLQAFRACLRVLRPGGLLVLSVRDYAAMERKNPDVRPYGLHRDGDARFLAVQVWEWDGDHYDLRVYLTSESPEGECRTQVLRSRYYAVTTDRLLVLLAQAGFERTHRRDDVLFQPVLIARKPEPRSLNSLGDTRPA
jgi:SAM-dependent methyltransferase